MIYLEHYTARDRKAICMSIEKLSFTHTFNYIVLRVNPGLTSCEDLAMALLDWYIALKWDHTGNVVFLVVNSIENYSNNALNIMIIET